MPRTRKEQRSLAPGYTYTAKRGRGGWFEYAVYRGEQRIFSTTAKASTLAAVKSHALERLQDYKDSR